MNIIKKIVWIFILLSVLLESCSVNYKKSINPNELERIFNDNKALFEEVKNVVDKKRETSKFDYISINDGNSKNNNGRIFVTQGNERKHIRNLNDIFNGDEIEKIEKIFQLGFIYIEDTKQRCSFSEPGSLDCYDEIVFTPDNDGLQKDDEDDFVIKRINSNWYIYGER